MDLETESLETFINEIGANSVVIIENNNHKEFIVTDGLDEYKFEVDFKDIQKAKARILNLFTKTNMYRIINFADREIILIKTQNIQ